VGDARAQRGIRIERFFATFLGLLWLERITFPALRLQWDLKVYLAAARAARAGLAPYAAASLARVTGGPAAPPGFVPTAATAARACARSRCRAA